MRDVVLLLDVDGPLGDFHSEARNVANALFGLNLKLEDFITWDVTDILPTQEMKDKMNAAIAEPGFASRILPQSGAVEAVHTLKGMCEVVFVTTPHPQSPTWMRERQDWLRKHFDVAHDEIVHAFRKQHVIGDILVDDRPKTVRRWEVRHPGAHALLWDMPYNRTDKGFKRIHSWADVISIVDGLRSEELMAVIREGE
ncbi:MAG: 5' nucleotidase, NT5C type [Rhizomicrobium sp.]